MSDRVPADADDEREPRGTERDATDNGRESTDVEPGAADGGNSRRLGSGSARRGRRQYDSDAAGESNPLGPFVVVLVGGSAGLIGLQSGATLAQIGLIVLAGAAVGAVLWLYLRRLGREMPSRRPRR